MSVCPFGVYPFTSICVYHTLGLSPALVSQNVTNKSYLACVQTENYFFKANLKINHIILSNITFSKDHVAQLYLPECDVSKTLLQDFSMEVYKVFFLARNTYTCRWQLFDTHLKAIQTKMISTVISQLVILEPLEHHRRLESIGPSINDVTTEGNEGQ